MYCVPFKHGFKPRWVPASAKYMSILQNVSCSCSTVSLKPGKMWVPNGSHGLIFIRCTPCLIFWEALAHGLLLNLTSGHESTF